MKIVADENIVAVADYFRAHGELVLLPGREISAADVADADVLLVRSITRVNSELLRNSSVKFVATATSGTDHIDLKYLAQAEIGFAEAGGSNANAVVEYCLSGIAELICRDKFSMREKTVAIIGFGHVGSRLHRALHTLGVDCVVCDPFVEERYAGENVVFCSLDEALQAPVISLHTPLTRTGPHPTFHLLDESRLARIQKGTLLINAARGEVVDNAALCQALAAGQELLTLWDVWENEPEINRALLRHVCLGTPHIAGYSVEAKLSASEMNYRSFLKYFELTDTLSSTSADDSEVGRRQVPVTLTKTGQGSDDERCLAECLRAAFAVARIDERLRDAESMNAAQVFDSIRKTLTSRREFAYYCFDRALLDNGLISAAVGMQLDALGFAFN